MLRLKGNLQRSDLHLWWIFVVWRAPSEVKMGIFRIRVILKGHWLAKACTACDINQPRFVHMQVENHSSTPLFTACKISLCSIFMLAGRDMKSYYSRMSTSLWSREVPRGCWERGHMWTCWCQGLGFKKVYLTSGAVVFRLRYDFLVVLGK